MALISNKKARMKYEILETLEAGIELFGFEVKAIKEGKASLEGARVLVRGNEAFLIGLTVQPYQVANTPKDYDPERTRRLLLHKKEILKVAQTEDTTGLTVVPLSVYNKNSLVKVEIAIVRGLKKHDKRERLKERSSKRHIERTLKRKI